MLADVALNIFAKPYQTALALLSLLKHSAGHVGRFYLQFEPAGSRYDAEPPYAVAEYLFEAGLEVEIFQPEIWVECAAVEEARLSDVPYRLAMRYQYAFEHTERRYLFILHNDVMFKRDILGAMLERADGAFILGRIGQCWNCPARDADLVLAAGLGTEACAPERYADFQPDFVGLERLYALAREKGLAVRPYWEGWETHYRERAWPLPECRVNEWACLVDVRETRPLTRPAGGILPLGAFEACGSQTLDTGVAWFRELSRQGFRAGHFWVDDYMMHWGGSARIRRDAYLEAEQEAMRILLRAFPDFVRWCREKKKKLF
ncbi:MAG: hypothetical protein FWG17_05570 [Desulfovibrionaceae bacterium]|nr:hypothetical protein [Desulfovibrionaceae bacterium]